MKIAFIGHKGYPSLYGGVEKVVEEIVNRLADKGHTCIVYSRQYYTNKAFENENVERVIIKGIKTSRLDTLTHTFLSIIDLRKRDVDVVAIHSFGNAVLNFLPRLMGIPVAMHLHGFEWGQYRFNFFERNILLKLPLLTLKRFSNYITTVSVAQHIELNKRSIKNEHLPNGVAFRGPNRFSTKNNGEKYILFVGRITWQKGIEYLVKAFNIANLSNVKLKIVGDYDHAQKYYEKLISLSKDNPNIEYLGYKYGKELTNLYSNAYCLVIPSETEECPMVLLEGMSLNKCIIASHIPGIFHIAKDNVMYFESKNYVQLSKLLQKVVLDGYYKLFYEEKLKTGDIMDNYNWEQIVNRYEDIYRDIAKPKCKKEQSNNWLKINLSFESDHSIDKKVWNDIVKKFNLMHKMYYKVVRPIVPTKYRHFVQKLYMKNRVYKRSFIDETVVDLVAENLKLNDNLYPSNYKTAILITHDIDTKEGLKFVPNMIEENKKHNIKACWYIVPYKYKIDQGIIDLIHDVGDEIGIHGFNHDGKLFSNKKVFTERVSYINDAIKRFNSKGFRAPMVHRNLKWLQELDLVYDSSCFDYDPFQPFPGGTGLIWPFKIGKLIELPYTIPQDHTLIYETTESPLEIWKKKIEWLVKNKGIILSVTHPDYLLESNNMEIYHELLEYLDSIDNAWRCLPSEMADWWLQKEIVNDYKQSNMKVLV